MTTEPLSEVQTELPDAMQDVLDLNILQNHCRDIRELSSDDKNLIGWAAEEINRLRLELEQARALLLSHIPNSVLDSDQITDDWWCPECQHAIACATNDERCTECGTYLADIQPTYEWAQKAKAFLSAPPPHKPETE